MLIVKRIDRTKIQPSILRALRIGFGSGSLSPI